MWDIAVHLVVAGGVCEGVFLSFRALIGNKFIVIVLSFFPRDVLDEILDLIESVS